MTEPVDDIKLVLRELLDAEWDATGALPAGLTTPDFSTGWHNVGLTVPQVTSGGPLNEDPVRGGNTGMSGFKPDGSGPFSRMAGTVQVNTWADRDEVGNGENPKDVAYEYAREVRRIVKADYQVADYTFPGAATVDGTGFEFIWPAPLEYLPDADESPVNHRYQVGIAYGYKDE